MRQTLHKIEAIDLPSSGAISKQWGADGDSASISRGRVVVLSEAHAGTGQRCQNAASSTSNRVVR